jgi:molybdopterin-guanine dinucleotide biosynthesis protein A
MASQISIPDTEISSLILAGGRGSRMDSTDKGLLSIAGKPVIEHDLQHLRRLDVAEFIIEYLLSTPTGAPA